MKAAACKHHWMPIGPGGMIDAAGGTRFECVIVCILCFKFTGASFDPLGYPLTAATAKRQRAARKESST